MLPQPLLETLEQALGGMPRAVRSLGVRDWSHTARIESNGQPLVVKWQPHVLDVPHGWPSVVAAEALGLRAITQTRTVRVPEVIAQGEQQGDRPAFVVIAWIEEAPTADQHKTGRVLGEQLASMHRATADAFGFEQHTWCGSTPQPNSWTTSWVEFYGQQRLGFLLELAARNGYLPEARRRRLQDLIERLDTWIDDQAVQPSLIHGDLWSGNWLIDMTGRPVVIDPAAYYGDRELELAMCRLFGGFPDTFFRAYDDAWPPAPGRDDRIPLYQLYHLLNHLNIFGESYGAQVDRVLQRYAG